MIRDAFCLFLICGCSPLKSTGLDTASTIDNNLSDDPDDPDDPTPLTGTLTVSGSRVFDPKLAEGHIRVDVSVNDEDTDCAITLSAKNGIGQSWTDPDASGAIVWNGEDDDGLTFDPGSVSLTITADCDLATHTLAETQIFIARLGLTSINFDNLIGDAIPMPTSRSPFTNKTFTRPTSARSATDQNIYSTWLGYSVHAWTMTTAARAPPFPLGPTPMFRLGPRLRPPNTTSLQPTSPASPSGPR